MKTSRGELFTGTTIGPPFNGQVRLQSAQGTTCSGAYTTDQFRTIRAPTVSCSDGRSASFTAKLEADMTSARGTAKFSDGSTADVGVGSRATAVELSQTSRTAATPARRSSPSGDKLEAERIVERDLKGRIDFPTSVQILSNRKTGNAGAICGYLFVTHPSGSVSQRRLFTAIVFYPEDGSAPKILPSANVLDVGVTFEDFADFCVK